ncbi:hypothetical protein PROFUN_06091 [Planoprotostelium fungivorum]|uniref:Uncharacterized protein n=1 Tax=Planoprotostelium fungivorum TaxID=1890364 RepID=A0A2P6NPT7_9EUKA|nr:hypothetical protein PROFUN_06091 [Planoprotostelium fungivorum]
MDITRVATVVKDIQYAKDREGSGLEEASRDRPTTARRRPIPTRTPSKHPLHESVTKPSLIVGHESSHSHSFTATEMIQIISLLILLASASSQSASSTVEFSVSNSELVNQLNYQSTTAANVRTYNVIKVGDTVITSDFASSSHSNASSGTGSGSSATNIVAWKSSPAGITWGTFSLGSNANSNSGIGQIDFSSSLIASAFNPLALVYYTDNNGNGLYDQGEELQSATTTASLSFSASYESSVTTGSSGVIIVTHVSGSVNFRYTVANRPISNQGIKVNDDSTKIDLQINPSYPSNAPANTRVALIALFGVVQSSSSFQGSVNNGNTTFNGSAAISVSNNGNSGGLTWNGAADITNSSGATSTTRVATCVLQIHTSSSLSIGGATVTLDATYKNNRVLVFNFQTDKPYSIYWDPEMGGSSTNTSSASSTASTSAGSSTVSTSVGSSDGNGSGCTIIVPFLMVVILVLSL